MKQTNYVDIRICCEYVDKGGYYYKYGEHKCDVGYLFDSSRSCRESSKVTSTGWVELICELKFVLDLQFCIKTN